MFKKVLIASGISIAVLLVITNGVVLAAQGVDVWQAFLMTQKALLDGFVAYCTAQIELFKAVL